MLTIYRASAGTGKTHKLTGEYLQLLFSGIDVHTRILSVTFTNKATDEMKSRIIKELHCLSSGHPSDYLNQLIDIHKKTEEQIRTQARKILIQILHDYARFNISTIDHFFQQTIRAFIREIGIQSNYRIEMDKELVLSESIDSLLSDLDKEDHKDTLEWLLRFSEDKVERGENWDLRYEIKSLSNELFKEKYKAYSKEIEKDIEDKQALTRYKNNLSALIRSTEAEAKQIGEKGIAILSQYNLVPSDFKGGSRSPMFFFEKLSKGEMKAPSDTFKNMADHIDACYTKTTTPDKKQGIESAFVNGLNSCILQVILFFNDLTDYYTAKEITRYYYTLGILTDISRHIKTWREEKNRMLIADTNELLEKVINGSDVPFIYERTGTSIEHYMIDEFQDTSEMQWRNFRPLIKESLAYQFVNLIVGDVKQSIYRFRNSDWTLLDEKVKQDFSIKEIKEETLTENWRSHRLIVEFNNSFFTIMPLLLQSIYNQGLEESALDQKQREIYETRIISAYNKSFQRVSPPRQSKDGHVRIEFLPDQEDCSWKEEAMNRIPSLIERLQDNGYALRDIAILVRTKVEGVTVAETLLSYKESHPHSSYNYDIISEDALILGNSFSVRFIVSMLHYLNRPNDPLFRQFAQMTYAAMHAKVHVASTGKLTFKELIVDFPTEVINELKRLSQRSFYEMVEGIYRLFETDFPANEQAFIQAFLDIVAAYIEKEPADTDQFLNWWKESGYREKIATPDSQNAIRILTIHKSKGLGFKVVVIPFGDWDVDQKSGSILWCHPQKSPFDQLHLVPVSYSKELSKTLFAEDYYHEKLHAFIDNLNALYVAFTRAKEELIIYTPDESAKRRKPVSRLIWDSLQVEEVNKTQEGEELLILSTGLNVENKIFEWGNWWHPVSDQQSETEEILMNHLSSILPDERLHLRLHRCGGFFDDKQRRYGLLMHDLLSRIQTKADIYGAVNSKESLGEIDKMESVELVERLELLLNLPKVKRWFDGSMQVMNEMEILLGNGKSYRPDRIMIDQGCVYVVDYKFGGIENDYYQHQVRKYLSLIRKIGYSSVKGYLWYVELNKIESVDS